MNDDVSEKAIIFAPVGRDAAVALGILAEAHIDGAVATGVGQVAAALERGAGFAIITEEALRTADIQPLANWIEAQPQWSDFPFIVLTVRGGVERNPAANRLRAILGNVTFLERPFHPTTLVSLAEAALRGRRRQYEARASLIALNDLNETLEARIEGALAEQRLLADARLQAEGALRQAQKMEAVGQLTGGVAHDFNNLLTIIQGGLTMLDRSDDETRRNTIKEAMRQAVTRGAALTRQLLAFSRNQPLETKTVNLGVQLKGMREMLDRALRGDVTVALECDTDCVIDVDPGELELAVLNLCVNARDAMPEGGGIRIAAACEKREEGKPPGRVRLTISDTGTGMTDEVKRRVFEPFFTTKDVGKGSGLGLAQVYGFAVQSRAEVTIDSTLGAGTSITILFPPSMSVPNEEETLTPSTARPLSARVLLVEDDADVAGLTIDMLREIGCTVALAKSGADAVTRLSRNEQFDIVLSDVMMPGGMSGVQLVKKVQANWPKLPFVLATGYAEAARDAVREGIAVLEKPYSLDALEDALRRQLPRTGN